MPDTKGSIPEEQTVEAVTPPRVKEKKRRHGVISVFILIICASVFIFSAYNIVKEQLENAATDKAAGEFQDARLEYNEDIVQSPHLSDGGEDDEGDSSSENIPSDKKEEQPRSFRIVFDNVGEQIEFLQAPLDSVKERNPDTVGWFNFPDSTGKVAGLPIDLPIVYSGDNEYYLSHNFDGEENMNGWVFVDYRNDTEHLSSNYNIILYGHARSDNMFGGLKYLDVKKSWYNDSLNHYIYIKTANEDTVWQVFAWYETSVAAETSSRYNYIRTVFSDPTVFVDFCNSLQNKNEIDAFEKFEFAPNDRILTLSTCKSYDKDVRVVVHAKLVKLGVWE